MLFSNESRTLEQTLQIWYKPIIMSWWLYSFPLDLDTASGSLSAPYTVLPNQDKTFIPFFIYSCLVHPCPLPWSLDNPVGFCKSNGTIFVRIFVTFFFLSNQSRGLDAADQVFKSLFNSPFPEREALQGRPHRLIQVGSWRPGKWF